MIVPQDENYLDMLHPRMEFTVDDARARIHSTLRTLARALIGLFKFATRHGFIKSAFFFSLNSPPHCI